MSEQKQKRELSASYWKCYSSQRTTFLEFVALFPEAFEVTEQGRSQKKKLSCLNLTKKAGKKLNFSFIGVWTYKTYCQFFSLKAHERKFRDCLKPLAVAVDYWRLRHSEMFSPRRDLFEQDWVLLRRLSSTNSSPYCQPQLTHKRPRYGVHGYFQVK